MRPKKTYNRSVRLLPIAPLVLLALLGSVCAGEPAPEPRIDDDLLQSLKALHTAAIDSEAKAIESTWTRGRVSRKQLVEKLIAATPAGVWLSHLSTATDSQPSMFYPVRLNENRFEISIDGFVPGPSWEANARKIDNFRENLHKQFGIPLKFNEPASEVTDDGTPARSSHPADWGFDRGVGARFDPPVLSMVDSDAAIFDSPALTPAQKLALAKETRSGAAFTLTFNFELIPQDLPAAPSLPSNVPLIAPPASADYPLWDGEETVQAYAARVGLPLEQTLDLGNSVTMKLLLIPAGEFTMGTTEPAPIDKASFRYQILLSWAALAVSIGTLFAMCGSIFIKSFIKQQKFNFSLSRLVAMTLAAGVAVMCGMHWSHTSRRLEKEEAELTANTKRKYAAFPDEMPAHKVTITRPFYMSQDVVTQEQFEQVAGINHSHFTYLSSCPAECVSWNDTQVFCRSVGKAAGQFIRLPTEAEWEYACRAGTTSAYYLGDDEEDLQRCAWYSVNSARSTTRVWSMNQPNRFGLHDMLGNVREWCDDVWSKYPSLPVIDPQNSAGDGDRVLRGGSWRSDAQHCRCAYRSACNPIGRYDTNGFRIVLPAARSGKQ